MWRALHHEESLRDKHLAATLMTASAPARAPGEVRLHPKDLFVRETTGHLPLGIFEGTGEESSQDSCGALVREMTKTHPWCCQRGHPRCKITVWAGDGAKHSHGMSQESSKLPTMGTVKSLKPFCEWNIRSYIGSLSSPHQRLELCSKQWWDTMTTCFP